MEGEKLLTVQEAAKQLGVGDSAIRNAVQRGKLAYVEMYGRKLLRESDLQAYKATARPGRPPKKAQPEQEQGAER
jgi:excisionase family DNA binding protein